MAVENGRIKMLDQEIKKLKTSVDKVHSLLGMERVSYELVTSQYEGLKITNDKLLKENKMIEEQNKQQKEAAGKVVADALIQADEIRADARALVVATRQKVKEIEHLISEIDKAKIKEHLDKVETLVA